MNKFWTLIGIPTFATSCALILAPSQIAAQANATPTRTNSHQNQPHEAAFGTGAMVDQGQDQVPRHEVKRPSSKPQPVVTRQTRFGIPFNITQAHWFVKSISMGLLIVVEVGKFTIVN